MQVIAEGAVERADQLLEIVTHGRLAYMAARMRRSDNLALAIATAIGLAGAEASAVGAPIVRESTIDQPVPLSSTKLVVASLQLAFDCYEKRALGECSMRATYRIVNPSPERERLTAAFATYDATDVHVTIDGAAAAVGPVPNAPTPAGGRTIAARVGFLLDVAPGESREVVVTAWVPLGRIHQPEGYTQPPAKAWHPWAGMATDPGTFTLDYLMAPINTWADVGAITISVRHPSWWALRGTFSRGKDEGKIALEWTETREGSALVSTTQTSGRKPERLTIELTPLPPIIENGGPFIGLGGRVGAHGGFRMRVGYDIAVRRLAIASVALESDLAHTMQIVPAIELATPTVLILPSVSLGVGAAVQVRPETRGAVRIQGSIRWFPLGLVGAVDIFPKPSPVDPQIARVSLFGQFAF
jgi:hypothetical protein